MSPENWCKEHKTIWFKSGKMKGYAHPIVGDDGEPTGEWCNKPKEEPKPDRESRIQEDIRENMEWKQKHIEKTFWWREVGDNFRCGLFKKDEGNGTLLWREYITQMLASLEITITKKGDKTE